MMRFLGVVSGRTGSPLQRERPRDLRPAAVPFAAFHFRGLLPVPVVRGRVPAGIGVAVAVTDPKPQPAEVQEEPAAGGVVTGVVTPIAVVGRRVVARVDPD